ncbi:hypothetical protein U6A24_05065 [Aquimarina gracilis]|uniref:Dihydroorotase n=1 Tax=Aquimarina gracilis TaxID=874422 RepID=A0ABU5ZRY3_9FLAO|nr:hypothetical protein [Aquimarina gracilis]MEB3344817.1 hypothetical protein [Aquimarina gracilis]
MKKALFFILLSIISLQAQEMTPPNQSSIEVGDKLIIGKPSAKEYQHIHFPKTNFIMKKGGIANYKALAGSDVTVTKIDKDQDGNTKITLKRTNGKKFFNAVAIVNANFEKALEEKEILLSN